MKISNHYDSAANKLTRQKPEAVESSTRQRQAASSDNKNSSVIDNISHEVYDALDEFIYLDGEDRMESFNNLNQEGKNKFLKIVSKMLKNNSLSDEKLDVEGVSEDKSIRHYLSEYNLYSPKNYDSSGGPVDLVSSQV